MSHLSLVTDNSPIKAPLAKRVYSFTFDLFAVAMINKAILICYTNILNVYFYQLSIHEQQKIAHGLTQASIMTLLTVFFSYFFFSYYWGQGQTLGKILFSLQVEGEKESLSMKESFLRTLGYALCYMTGFFLFTIPFFRKDRIGLPDWLSNTNVIVFAERVQEIEEESEQLPLFDEEKDAA